MNKKKTNEEYWMQRAILAEQRVRELQEELKSLLSVYKKMD